MSDRVHKERDVVRKRIAEVKRIFSLSPQEHFNPMGFSGLQWLVTGVGFSVALVALLYLVSGKPVTPVETYQQYADRCLKPQLEPFKRDFTCITDAQKFRPAIVTPQG